MKLGQNVIIALVVVAILWGVLIADWFLPLDLRRFGIRPGSSGIPWGVLFSPFLHANTAHLAANSGALFVLLILSLSFGRLPALEALTVIVLGGGGLVWFFGQRGTVHIGASGVIFGLIGFLIFAGLFHRNWKALILSLIVFFMYGASLLTLLVHTPGVSWSGHFFGFLSGVVAAWLTRPRRATH
ncbi:MAG: rhomboid family intramembrane serine protease [Proteobacteria bacterium]|nr:rhomboid family intramembrane serine protease [Pseudomonadota bacterium]